MDPNKDIALVCIAKNEDKYIDEWIQYHLKLGFNAIHIYQNDWKHTNPHPKATYHDIPGNNKQEEAYNQFLKAHHQQYRWAAFLDIDEYLVLKQHKNIHDFIKEYSLYPAIGINWVLYGDNGMEEPADGDYSLLKRFTRCQDNINVHVKPIVRLNKNSIMNVHCPQGALVDTNYNVFYGALNHKGTRDKAQVNHYFCKTKVEFLEKLSRGRADLDLGHPDQIRPLKDFVQHNINTIEDKSALDFWLS